MTQLYIGNLNYKTTEESMKNFFSKYGAIKDIKIIQSEGRSKGFGFITFEEENNEISNTVLKDNGVEFEGRELKIERSKPLNEENEEVEEPKIVLTAKAFVRRKAGEKKEETKEETKENKE